MRAALPILALAVPMLSATPALAQNLPPPVVLDPRPLAYAGPPATFALVTTIRRQLQPCADRQFIPAPEASEIIAIVRLELNRDGSVASLRILGHEGVTDTNRRYVPRVDTALEAMFAGCTPFEGLPPELYDGPRGWRKITFRYRLKS